jgi:hypothetical protein
MTLPIFQSLLQTAEDSLEITLSTRGHCVQAGTLFTVRLCPAVRDIWLTSTLAHDIPTQRALSPSGLPLYQVWYITDVSNEPNTFTFKVWELLPWRLRRYVSLRKISFYQTTRRNATGVVLLHERMGRRGVIGHYLLVKQGWTQWESFLEKGDISTLYVSVGKKMRHLCFCSGARDTISEQWKGTNCDS